MAFQNYELCNLNNTFSWTSFDNKPLVDCNPQSLISTMDSQEFVNKWLSSKSPKFGNDNISSKYHIPNVMKSIHSVLNVCEKISTSEAMLRDDIKNLSDSQWKKSIENITKWKNEISHELIFRENDLCTKIKDKLSKNFNKRERLKRKREQAKLRRKQQKKLLEMNNVNMKIQITKEKLERDKEEEEFRLMAENAMKDVNKHKATARKYLSLLDTLTKLRDAREKTSLGRGEKTNNQISQEFVYNIEKLKDLWTFALKEYSVQESILKEKLKTDDVNVNNSPVDNTKSINGDFEKNIKLWKCALFGSEDIMPQRDFKQNTQHFLAVRRLWDQYLSNEEDASSIPTGWVVPLENNGN